MLKKFIHISNDYPLLQLECIRSMLYRNRLNGFNGFLNPLEIPKYTFFNAKDSSETPETLDRSFGEYQDSIQSGNKVHGTHSHPPHIRRFPHKHTASSASFLFSFCDTIYKPFCKCVHSGTFTGSTKDRLPSLSCMRAECIRMASISRSRVKRSLLLVRSTTPRTISWTRRVDHS